jgi:ATP-dependent Lhr-like helicase
VAAQVAAVDAIPTQRKVIFERFFDESGGMQLVVHAPFGARINRAWGLAMRKCFCRTFDFELQASADDNGIVLSIGPQQSFPLEQMFRLVDTTIARDVLIQALLVVPMFLVRWRWNVTRALAVLRQRAGKKVPPNLQRFRADDLLTAVFPSQTQCFEHRTGDLVPPDHPMVRQSIHDCLHEVMDFPGWLEVLSDIEAGRIELVARDTREPSPFSHQLVNANVYAFLDDAPLEERRARAVAVRRTFRPEDVRDLGQLDPEAIAQVRSEAAPLVRDAEELHDTLLSVGALPESEGLPWRSHFEELSQQGRVVRREVIGGPLLWLAVEQWPVVNVALALADATPPATLRADLQRELSIDDARMLLVRGRLEISGPTTARRIAGDLGMPANDVQIALEQLELSGIVLRGHFTAEVGPPSRGGPLADLVSNAGAARLVTPTELEWCERRLLARIHRLTLDGLRRQVAPIDAEGFMRFLLAHHEMSGCSRPTGVGGLQRALAQLEGFEAAASAWEHDLLPGRVAEYEDEWLDQLFASGEIVWGRVEPPQLTDDSRGRVLTRISPISLLSRADLGWLLPRKTDNPVRRTTNDGQDCPSNGEAPVGFARWDAQATYEALSNHGALFFHDLLAATKLLPAQLEDALRELAALGLVTSDGFAAVRGLSGKSRHGTGRRTRRLKHRKTAYSQGGRWSKFPPLALPVTSEERAEQWAWLLLRRYGVMFRDLLTRESVAPPWRDLLPVFRRLEMRGEIRGGRFVSGVAGEQFALSDAVERLRQHRERPEAEEWSVISAVDPLNLIGVVTPGVRVPAVRGNRIVLLNGRSIAARERHSIRWLADVDDAVRQKAERLLTLPRATRRNADSKLLLNGDWDVDSLAGASGSEPRAPAGSMLSRDNG